MAFSAFPLTWPRLLIQKTLALLPPGRLGSSVITPFLQMAQGSRGEWVVKKDPPTDQNLRHSDPARQSRNPSPPRQTRQLPPPRCCTLDIQERVVDPRRPG